MRMGRWRTSNPCAPRIPPGLSFLHCSPRTPPLHAKQAYIISSTLQVFSRIGLPMIVLSETEMNSRSYRCDPFRVVRIPLPHSHGFRGCRCA